MTANAIETRSFATPRQRVKIAQLCVALGIRERLEEHVTTSEEASGLISQMCDCLRKRRISSRHWVNGGLSYYS